MRTWPHSSKQMLRLLLAARHFLPENLDSPASLEQQYQAHVRTQTWPQALALLEQIGDQHAGWDNEMHFWKELYYAARQLDLPGQAARYQERLRQLAELQRLQFQAGQR